MTKRAMSRRRQTATESQRSMHSICTVRPLYRRVKDGTKAESYQYTSEGLMKAVISAGMHYNYEYDPMGRIIRKSASGRTLLAYGYDLNDNLTTRRYMTRNGLCMMLINILKNLIAGVISTVL